jgi:Fic family protein
VVFVPSLRKGHWPVGAEGPVPTFEQWLTLRVDTQGWGECQARLENQAHVLSRDDSARSVGIATRAAAFLSALPDGLAIEDHELTRAVAHELPGWELELGRHVGFRRRFELQLDAYRSLHLSAIAGEPQGQQSIKRLHEVVCGNQSSYLVTATGHVTQHPLPKGRYKHLPNYVGHGTSMKECARVAEVDAHMARYADELSTEVFATAHPVLQASYALHSLLAIHPFADGNGRVARALASMYFYRALSLPFFVESSDRAEYLESLRCADGGDAQPLVDFVARRGFEAAVLALESVRRRTSVTAS